MKPRIIFSVALATAALRAASDPLEAGFVVPPLDARPEVYWVWPGDYMHAPSAIGELRAMKAAGIGGVMLNSYGIRGEAALLPPAGPAFLSPEWLDQLKLAAREAKNLGIKLNFAVSSADMGGPWIEPRLAAKALYTTETTITGGRRVQVALPFPSAERGAPKGADGHPAFWQDIAVLALRDPQRAEAHEFVWRLNSEGMHDLAAVAFDQGQPRAPADLAATMSPVREFSVSVSDSGARTSDFTEVLHASLREAPGAQRFSLPPGTKAKYVRLRLLSSFDASRPHWTLGEFALIDTSDRNLMAFSGDYSSGDRPTIVRAPAPLNYSEWDVRSINDGRTTGPGRTFATAGRPAVVIGNLHEIVDVTKNVGRDGILRWDAPEGQWTLLRYVCMMTGEKLKVPGPLSDGLASDKLDPEGTRVHMNHVIAQLRKGLGQNLAESGLGHLYLPSHEPMGKEWSPGFAEEFRRRRGYDITSYMPALCGAQIVDDETTERFLFDYAKTVGEVAIDAYYRVAVDIANTAGLLLRSEAGGPGPPIQSPPFDALLAHGVVNHTQGEFWPYRPKSDAINVIKEPASAAHLYGKRYVFMEAFTSNQHWAEGPQDLKESADRVFCEGGNRFVWHKWVHVSPDAGMPGWAYHAGTHLNQNVTWWSKAPAFLLYLSRCSYMLQQGNFVGDVLYYYGDAGANFVKSRQYSARLGSGYDYDVTNAEIILKRLQVRDHRLVLPDGTSYAALVLPDREDIHPDVLERIERLVDAGATLVGSRPKRASGFEGFPHSDARVKQMADRLWGDLDGKSRTVRPYGAGLVVDGKAERAVLAERGVSPDFIAEPNFEYTHRRLDGAEIYFVRNREASPVSGVVTFRDGLGDPEFWDPVTGAISPAGAFRRTNAGTELTLALAGHGSKFVVLRTRRQADPIATVSAGATVEWHDGHPQLITEKTGTYAVTTASGRTREAHVPALPESLTLNDKWTVEFASPIGGPNKISLEKVAAWTRQEDPEIRYFPGSAKYRHTVVLPKAWREGAKRVELDLGGLWSIGEVWINDIPLGVVWTAPYRVDCTGALRDGSNEIVVEVIGTWRNRLLGEARNEVPKLTRTNVRVPGLGDTKLIDSGLFGPVRLVPLAVRRVD